MNTAGSPDSKPLCALTHLEALAQIKDISERSSGFAVWWAMVEAQEELAGKPIPDSACILHFMGSGASTMVTAREIRGMLAAIFDIKP